MKITFILPVFFLVLITACSKDDVSSTPTTNTATEKYRLAEAKYSNGSTNKFEYNATGKLTKILTNGNLTNTYNYDSQERLTRVENTSNYQYYFKDYTYSSNNVQPNESITRYKVAGDAQETKIREVYTYANNLLTEMNYAFWNSINGNYSPPILYKYEYDSNKNLIKFTIGNNNYSLYTYDTNGNTTEIKQFELKQGSTTAFYMWRSTNYTFDNKKNLTSNLYPNPTGNNKTIANNQLDRVLKNFEENGATSSINNETKTYEYNEAGYPVKATTNGIATNYVLEKISN